MKAPRIAGWLVSITLLACLAGLQHAYDASAAPTKKLEQDYATEVTEPLIPSLPSLRALSLGDQPLVADLLWLDTVQYFGTSNPYAKYGALPRMLDTITQLDPKFEYPYEFGLVVLPFMNASETAASMGERAQKELPGNGLLSFYLGTVYQINLKDYKKAAEYYVKAANEPGAPTAAKELAGISLAKINQSLNDREVAMAFWKTVYEESKDDSEKERALNWYKHMQLVLTLEQTAQAYKEKTGAFPATLQDLVTANYLPEIPDSPIGRRLDYDASTGTISFDHLANR